MVQHANVLSYFLQAGPVVKSVMFILLVASVVSWTLIFQRIWFFKQKKSQMSQFKETFWSSQDLSSLFTSLDKQSHQQDGLASMFYYGFKEFLRLRQKGTSNHEPIQRMMQINQAKEAERLEKHLSLFASIGSIAPYVGLFGTVWGIMTSFQALGQAQQATIAMVAPGISEALVATALGLFTAIPAVIAYNRFTTKSNDLMNQYDLFQEEFIALIDQQASH